MSGAVRGHPSVHRGCVIVCIRFEESPSDIARRVQLEYADILMTSELRENLENSVQLNLKSL